MEVHSQDAQRWALMHDGSISWPPIANESHQDHIEMSGFQLSAILHYGVIEGKLHQKVHLVFPMLRTIPNDTHGSLAFYKDSKDLPALKVNGETVLEYPYLFRIRGMLEIKSKAQHGVEIQHQLFPSTDEPVFVDRIVIKNTSDKPVYVDIPDISLSDTTESEKGVYGAYILSVTIDRHGHIALQPKDSLAYAVIYTGRLLTENLIDVSVSNELEERMDFVHQTFSDLVLVTPEPVLNRAFDFAKLRATESIYATRGGLMHGPGGGRYYAAIWANDQAEYANPFFPFLGNPAGNESAINSFRHFA